jgi:4-diphosphocytidyl-2-methyl-D-erithritol synthase
MRKNIGVILAGGVGNRSGFSTPKQFVKLAGKPVIEHCLATFDSSRAIDEIVIVTHKDCLTDVEAIVLRGGYKKVRKILQGGKERWESSWSAIQAYEDDPNNKNINLIFHDAVRPLISYDILDRVSEGLKTHGAIDVVIKAVDTIVKADDSGNFIDSIPDRSFLRSGQTPQAFHYDVIKNAYRKALEQPSVKVTDDCGIVLQFLPQQKIYLVEGSQYNQKLTYNEDLAILDKLFQFKKSSYDTEIDEALFKENKDKVFVVTGGSSGIGLEVMNLLKKHGIAAHSLSKREGVDITNIESVKKAFADINQKAGRIDYVINSAGLLLKEPFGTMEYSDLMKVISTNYIGAMNVAYAGFEYLKKSSGGLLFFTSSSYTYGRAFYSAYSSSKAAIVNLTQALAEEWAPSNIRVNCLNPERTLTPMRLAAFGREDESTLLNATDVGVVTLKVTVSPETGLIVDVKKKA